MLLHMHLLLSLPIACKYIDLTNNPQWSSHSVTFLSLQNCVASIKDFHFAYVTRLFSCEMQIFQVCFDLGKFTLIKISFI